MLEDSRPDMKDWMEGPDNNPFGVSYYGSIKHYHSKMGTLLQHARNHVCRLSFGYTTLRVLIYIACIATIKAQILRLGAQGSLFFTALLSRAATAKLSEGK